MKWNLYLVYRGPSKVAVHHPRLQCAQQGFWPATVMLEQTGQQVWTLKKSMSGCKTHKQRGCFVCMCACQFTDMGLPQEVGHDMQALLVFSSVIGYRNFSSGTLGWSAFYLHKNDNSCFCTRPTSFESLTVWDHFHFIMSLQCPAPNQSLVTFELLP